jgi:hypothetical protein
LFSSRAVRQRSAALPKQAVDELTADRIAVAVADGSGRLSPDRRGVVRAAMRRAEATASWTRVYGQVG